MVVDVLVVVDGTVVGVTDGVNEPGTLTCGRTVGVPRLLVGPNEEGPPKVDALTVIGVTGIAPTPVMAPGCTFNCPTSGTLTSPSPAILLA